MNEENKITLQLDLDIEQSEDKIDLMIEEAEKLVSTLKEADSLLNDNNELHVISFNNKNILLDGKSIKGVTDLKVEKNSTDTADVTLKLKAYIKGLDDA